jgi:hypothetical protein
VKPRVDSGIPCAGPECRGNIHGNKQETLLTDFKDDSKAFGGFACLELICLGTHVIKENHLSGSKVVEPILPIDPLKRDYTGPCSE